MADKAPTEQEVAEARKLLARASQGQGDPAQATFGALVISENFTKCYNEMLDAQRNVPWNTELNYAISMMARLTETFTPR